MKTINTELFQVDDFTLRYPVVNFENKEKNVGGVRVERSHSAMIWIDGDWYVSDYGWQIVLGHALNGNIEFMQAYIDLLQEAVDWVKGH